MFRKVVVGLAAGLLAALVIGCGNGGSTPVAPPPSVVSVTISPASATLFLRGTQAFKGTVTGASDTRVTYEVTGGGSAGADGLYQAPNRAGSYKIRAWSMADPTKFAEASITVNGYQEKIGDVGKTNDGYDGHTADLLSDGSVLIVGGYGGAGLHERAERFTPGEVGVRPAASLLVPRRNHASVVLQDGRLLISGGYVRVTAANFFDPVFKSSEIYDPATDRFTSGPEMNWARRGHTLTLLADGRVLAVGGISLHGDGFSANPQSEVYSPTDSKFTLADTMKDPRWLHTATRLKDGRVLVVGGRPNNCLVGCSVDGLKTAEIFDPATGKWAFTGSLHVSRYGHSAALLSDGRVVIFGGESTEDLGDTDQVREVEIYDPATGSFSTFGHLQEGRSFHALAELHDGRFLIAGGNKLSDTPMYSTEIFNPETRASVPGPDMRDFRIRARAVKLKSGEVLIVGGHNSGQAVAPLDLFR